MEDVGVQRKLVDGKIILKVSGKTPVATLAGAITKTLEEHPVLEVHTIGAASLNQAVKGIAKARGFVAMKGRDLIVRPGFGDTVIDGEEITTLIQVCSIV